MSMNIKAPKKKRSKPTPPPTATETKGNLDKPARGTSVQLKLNIDADIKKQFKSYAAEHDVSMSDLFVKAFEFYRMSN